MIAIRIKSLGTCDCCYTLENSHWSKVTFLYIPTDADLTEVIHTSPNHNTDLCSLPCFPSHCKTKATEINKAYYLFSEAVTYQIENTITRSVGRVGLIFVLVCNLR